MNKSSKSSTVLTSWSMFALDEMGLPHSPFLPSGFQRPEFLTWGPLGSPKSIVKDTKYEIFYSYYFKMVQNASLSSQIIKTRQDA